MDHCANINDVDRTGSTVLHIAAKHSNMKLVKHILNRGADVTIVNAEGQSPLHFAIDNNASDEVISYLTEWSTSKQTRTQDDEVISR